MPNLISAILSALAPVFHNPSTICSIVHRLVALRVSRSPSWTVSAHDHRQCSLSHAAGHPGDVATDHVWRVRCTRRDGLRHGLGDTSPTMHSTSVVVTPE